jgi:RNA polymerase sigma factor (sigma-70 family)
MLTWASHVNLLANERASAARGIPAAAASAVSVDPVLLPLIDAAGDDARRAALEQILVTVAAPVVQAVLRHKSFRYGPGGRFAREDEEDLAAGVMVRLVRRLSVDLTAHPILDLRDYAAAVTKHEVGDYFRRRYAERSQVRVVDDGEIAEIVDDGFDPLQRLQLADMADAVWREIRVLPPQQRAAVLLNLRDADGAPALPHFIVAGVATLADLAAAVDLALAEFAELWRELPLPDAKIAERLGIARQRVINLRQAARKRLVRRLNERGMTP